MAKKHKKKTSAAKAKEPPQKPLSEAAKKYEREEYPAVSLKDKIVAGVALIVISVAWISSAPGLFVEGNRAISIQLGSFYFACLAWLYIVRCMLESKRRYDVVTVKSCFYYSQSTIYAQKRCLSIFIVLFATATVIRWLVPSPNLSPTCMDMVGCYYLAYVHSVYCHKEPLPFRWMETLFLLLTYVSPYIVYFMTATA